MSAADHSVQASAPGKQCTRVTLVRDEYAVRDRARWLQHCRIDGTSARDAHLGCPRARRRARGDHSICEAFASTNIWGHEVWRVRRQPLHSPLGPNGRMGLRNTSGHYVGGRGGGCRSATSLRAHAHCFVTRFGHHVRTRRPNLHHRLRGGRFTTPLPASVSCISASGIVSDSTSRRRPFRASPALHSRGVGGDAVVVLHVASVRVL